MIGKADRSVADGVRAARLELDTVRVTEREQFRVQDDCMRTGLRVADFVRRAIRIALLVDEVAARGGSVRLIESDGSERELIVL